VEPTPPGELVTPPAQVPLKLEWIQGRYAVCRLDPRQQIPSWALNADGLVSITRTHDELSIIVHEELVPDGVRTERGWVALRVVGDLDFSIVGIVARLTTALEKAGVATLVISTYRTDALLIKSGYSRQATDALRAAGFVVLG
jgi:hypothetical protein